MVRVQTKARRIELGARAQAAVEELERRKSMCQSLFALHNRSLHLALTLC